MYKALIDFIRDWYQTGKRIPLHEPRFKETDKQYVQDTIDSTFVSSVGKYVNRFEKELARYLGAQHAVATVNGTAALQVALQLAGVGKEEEVILQPLTFIATANAVSYNQARPVFIDVDKETLGLCPEALESFLSRNAEKGDGGAFNKDTKKRISAIVPMHTFGHPCQMDRILEIADYWGIPVVEDAAEALGSHVFSKQCGTFGVSGIFSFNGNKIITCGGGGAIITNDRQVALKAKHITTTAKLDHPWEFVHDEIGYNFRMPNLNASLACAQLEHLDAFLCDKRLLANAYKDFFENERCGTFVSEPNGSTSNYWLNAVITSSKEKRDELLKITNESGIMTRPVWQLVSDLSMYNHFQTDNLKTARWLSDRVVNLPSSARANA